MEEQERKFWCKLSQVIGKSQLAKELTFLKFKKGFSPFKDAKKVSVVRETLLASYCFISSDPSWYRSTWDWRLLWQLVENNDKPEIKWLAMQCIRVLCNISDKEYFDWMKTAGNFSPEQLRKFRLDYQFIYNLNQSLSPTKTEKIINELMAGNSVNIYGIPMVKFNETLDGSEKGSKMVIIPSVRDNLMRLAVALSENRPVLLEGPLGCGKTSLIEHLSELTGRCKPPELTKIQIGNQVDGKLLVGTYCCTDVIGEFIWKPGPLTEALIKGHWLVFEDIDCASADVLTILLSIIKSRSLNAIPGCYASNATIDPRFRLFFTRRITDGHTEAFSNVDKDMLIKMCEKISITNPTHEELEQIITVRWPNLIQNITRICEIYKIVVDDVSSTDNFDPISSSNRKASLRDFLKWCQRISLYFQQLVLNDAQREACLLDANDCFLENISNRSARSLKSQAVGVQLNIAAKITEQILLNRKPEISVKNNLVTVGRANLPVLPASDKILSLEDRTPFSKTNSTLCLLEKISCSVSYNEPVLLVGETGTGKTSTVQYLCNLLNRQLTVINMNQQSDTCDLLGGYKPVKISFLMKQLRDEFDQLFTLTFNQQTNAKFLRGVSSVFRQQRWDQFLEVLLIIQQRALEGRSNTLKDRSLEERANILERWRKFGDRINKLKSSSKEVPLVFTYIEGTLVRAMRQGDWILLDEINLAESETLQCLSSILESDEVLLLDKADGEPVKKHPDFRLFACMNPSTDIGKRDLPLGIRNRFTEFYVEELESEIDLRELVSTYLKKAFGGKKDLVERIVKFYLNVRHEAKKSLKDAVGGSPIFTLRTLCRALQVVVASTWDESSSLRILYEAFCLAFLTQLNAESYSLVRNMILRNVLKSKNIESITNMTLAKPKSKDCDYILIDGYWIPKGPNEPLIDETYILTDSVSRNLRDVSRIISLGRSYPILIQGETSVGKTSMINYLAKRSGNVCLRVNNHEHTDLQEYIGSYTADDEGKLVFKKGVLVEAMENGYWIILDELNLASTEVLEALNRVLDDNRELFIPETQELIKANKNFLLFATQNPPGHYGGRKILSRAFRNRFIELHFDEIPSNELEIILQKRCLLPPSYAKKMVMTLTQLRNRLHQSVSLSFAGKHGGVTLRDLFRWGERYRLFCKDFPSSQRFYNWDQHLANEGYMLLAGRSRNQIEEQVIHEVLGKIFNIQNFNPEEVFEKLFQESLSSRMVPDDFHHLFWTLPLKRLAVLLFQALKYNEPVLLVGETGCGKTTICQLFASLRNKPLFSVNCHMHSESSDFLGSLRPVRHHSDADDDETNQRLFEWVDGPLVKAMQLGSVFLIDEISLADDSVLERLNSVIEPERLLLLTEKGFIGKGESNHSDLIIKAHPDFHLVATMNPGGDYGKKELSPALRNRFTEIWCYSSTELNDLRQIISHNLIDLPVNLKENIVSSLCSFLEWFLKKTKESGIHFTSIRDVLSLVNFVSTTMKSSSMRKNTLNPIEAISHAVHLVFLDSLGSSGSILRDAVNAKRECEAKLFSILDKTFGEMKVSSNSIKLTGNKNVIGIAPFFIPKGNYKTTLPSSISSMYIFDSPTVASNTQRLLRAMQLSKPILIEGVPGVGKTSLVQSMAKAANYQVIRINLSEQTDVSDLFGADLPVEGCEGRFSWRDGPLLQALKSDSCWILLDELNLASQSVLEGLNACLDHRGEIFIPELGKTFSVSKQATRIFACQNPHAQGGDRKGLPKSFLNRFTVIHVESLTTADLKFIVSNVFSTIPNYIIDKMVTFNEKLVKEIEQSTSFGRRGSPWEFNLRDIFRWCQLILASIGKGNFDENVANSMKILYSRRFRTREDIEIVERLFESVFDCKLERSITRMTIYPDLLQVGHSFLPRTSKVSSTDDWFLLYRQLPIFEALMKCVEMNWMTLIVGSSQSGKSSLVHLLSKLVGVNLKTIVVNSEMDTIELLGGFNQKDVVNDIERIETSIEPLIWNFVRLKTVESNHSLARETLKEWSNYKTSSSSCETANKCLKRLKQLQNIVEKVILNDSQKEIYSKKLQKLIGHIKERKSLTSRGTFQWIDSVLVDALREGDWLLIDDTNLCPASVLDRLNGLLEPDGELVLNEQGCVDGNVPVVRPHPNFRLFLTIDPKNGELSRAMRNRGVEIFVAPSFNESDIRCQMIKAGLTSNEFQNALLAHHSNLVNSNYNLTEEQLNGSYLVQLASRIALELKCGTDIKKICQYYPEISSFFSSTNPQVESSSSLNQFDLAMRDFRVKLGDILISNLKTEFSIVSSALSDRDFQSTELNKPDLIQIFASLALFLLRSSKEDSIYRSELVNSKFEISFDISFFDCISKSVLMFDNQLPCSSTAVDYLPMDIRFNTIMWNKIASSLNGIESADIQRNLNCLALKIFNWALDMIQQHLTKNSKTSLLSRPFDRANQLIIKCIPPILTNLKTQRDSNLANMFLSDEELYDFRTILIWIHQFECFVSSDCNTTDYENHIFEKLLPLWVIVYDKLRTHPTFKLNFDSSFYLEFNSRLRLDQKTPIECFAFKKHLSQSLTLYKDASCASLFVKTLELSRLLAANGSQFTSNHNKNRFLNEIVAVYGKMYKEEFSGLSEQLDLIGNEMRKTLVFSEKEDQNDDIDERNDQEISLSFEKPINMMSQLVIPLNYFTFFWKEICHLKSLEPITSVTQLLPTVCISPMHSFLIKCLPINVSLLKETFLHHLSDFQYIMTCENLYSLFLSKETQEQIQNDEIEKSEWLKFGYHLPSSPGLTLLSSKLLNSASVLGTIDCKAVAVEKLQSYIFDNFKTLVDNNYHNFTNNFLDILLELVNNVKSTIDDFLLQLDPRFRLTFLKLWQLVSEDHGKVEANVQGAAMVLFGTILTHLWSPTMPIDPLQKWSIKLLHYQEELNFLDGELSAYNRLSILDAGENMIPNSEHLHVSQALKRKATVLKKIEKLKSRQGYRPVPSRYQKLRHEVVHFLSTLLPLDKMFKLVEKIDRLDEKIIGELVSLQKSVSNFINNIRFNYPLYANVTNEMLLGLSLTRYGLNLSSHVMLTQKTTNLYKTQNSENLFNELESLFRLRNSDPISRANDLIKTVRSEGFKHLTSLTQIGAISSSNLLYKSALTELLNAAHLNIIQNEDALVTLFKVIDTFLKFWMKEEAQRKEKKAEEDSLFLYKSKVHPDELPEEILDEIEMSQKFPTYEHEFREFIKNPTNSNQDSIDQNNKQQSTSNREIIQEQDIIEICNLHKDLLSILLRRQSQSTKSIDIFKPLAYRYQVSAEIVDIVGPVLGRNLDSVSVESSWIMTCLFEKTLSSTVSSSSSSFNFYKDPKPEELRECFNILEPIKNRILSELLPQFPGNPMLHQLLLIIERLYGLNINSPLAKIVTGLEVLLRSAEDWEQMAHRKIKLSEQLSKVTSLIIKWRKMELKCWSTQLDSVHHDIESKQMSKYWFHFYSLIHSILTTEENDQERNEENEKQLLTLLRRFFEESTIGQFNPRLRLLENFIDHQLCVDSRRSQLPLFTILVNVHKYYLQFKSSVSEEIDRIRKPIEKELKDFVKIMRWNDGNFWSLKAKVEKSHKTLHRLTKKYDKSLSVPTTAFFKLAKSESNTESFNFKSTVMETTAAPLEPIHCSDLKLLPRSHQLISKVSKYSKKTKVLTRSLRKSIKRVDNRTGDIIEGIKEMANLKIPPGVKEKEKYEKELKSINNMKRQSFSNLLKQLGTWGISFKKGVEMYNSFDLETVLASCRPFEPIWGLSITKDETDFMDKYFYSILSRYNDFKAALTNPSNDIKEIQNVFERLKGTAGFMLNEIISSKSKLFEQLCSLRKFRNILETVSICSNRGNKLSSPSLYDHWISIFSQRNVSLQCSLRQIKELPVESNSTDIEQLRSIFEKSLLELDKLTLLLSSSPLTSYKSLIVSASSESQLEDAWEQLGKISSELKSHLGSTKTDTGTVADQLMVVCNQISEDLAIFKTRHYPNDSPSHCDQTFEAVFNQSECFLVSVLSHIQKLFLRLKEDQPKEVNDTSMDKIYSKISQNALNELNLTRMQKEIEKVLSSVSSSIDDDSQPILQDIVSHIHQYLSSYVDLLTHITSLNLSSFRTRCKLLYVLLGLFTDVCKQGFCLPPPWQDENEKTIDKDKLKDLTDAGLGEGEGEEDVSNKIESEDQLDEAMPSGAQKEQDKSDDKDIKDEKNGIEMSEDFDAPDFGPDENDENDDKNESDDDKDDEDDDLDKKMGDIDDSEGLDDKMWGDDDEDEDEDDEDEEGDDDGDEGGEEIGDDRLVAKDDNQGIRDKSEGKDKNKDNDDESENEEINEQKVDDEYEGEKQDPFKKKAVGEEEDEECKEAEEFPEDMDLDGNDGDSENGEDDNEEEAESKEDKDLNDEQENESFEETVPEDIQDQPSEANKSDEEAEDQEKAPEEVENDEGKEDDPEKKDSEEKDSEDPSAPDNQQIETEEAPMDSGVDSELKPNAQVDPFYQQDERNMAEGARELDANKEDNEGAGTSSNPHEGQSNEGKIKSSTIHEESENQSGSVSKPRQKKRGHKSTSETPSKATKKQRILERHEPESPKTEANQNKEENQKQIDSSLVQHCSEDEESTKEVIDIAEDADAAKSRPENLDENKLEESEIKSDEDFIEPEEMETDDPNEGPVQKKKPEKSLGNKQDTKTGETMDTPEGCDADMVDLEGDFRETSTVARGLESQFYSKFGKTEDDQQTNQSWFDKLHEKIEKSQLMSDEARKDAWNQCEKSVGPLVYELCQQLQLVLEPMKAAKMKGDYRTGKRLNMRKVIEYIASSYKKDKIWLRRTKPSKRQYQIILAIDDSASMLDNDSKKIAFESIALLGKSLSLIEAGELALMSFGESVNKSTCFTLSVNHSQIRLDLNYFHS
uniref:Midasin n=1 Tax=Tetranychus urticae TaxID=32264 RepID=T1K3A0_TETUR